MNTIRKLATLFIALALVLAFGLEAHAARKPLPDRVIDINKAGIEDLVLLPHIGVKRAELIIAYREEHGGFHRPEELMMVRGIGERTYEGLEPYVTVGDQEEAPAVDAAPSAMVEQVPEDAGSAES